MLSRLSLSLLSLVLAASPPAQAQFIQQGNALVGSGAAGPMSNQGVSVAISADGNTAIVGSNFDDTNNDTGGSTGAAWIFTRTNGAWSQQGNKLVGTGAAGQASQGGSVAISADGNTAILGGAADNDGAGAAWVFTRSNGVWTQQAKLTGSGAAGAANQGVAVAISGDGNTAILGGYFDNAGVGAAWIFTRSSGAWTQQGQKLAGLGAVGFANQGVAVGLSGDGNTAIVGGDTDNFNNSTGLSAGAAWVFTRSSGVWTQQGNKLDGSGAAGQANQGLSVAISSDGNTAIVGGFADNNYAGAAWIFTRANGVWTQQGNKLAGPGAVGQASQGGSVAISGDGSTAIVGGNGDNNHAGAAWIFTRTNGAWSPQGSKLVGIAATGSAEGSSVALSADASTALLGGPGLFVGSPFLAQLRPSSLKPLPAIASGGTGATWVFAQPRFSFNAPATAAGGTPFGLMVSALDANNLLLANYAGTVHFSSSDSAAVLPADSTLTAGMGNFSATLKTGGSQTITAADTANSGVHGTSAAIAVAVAATPPSPVSVSVANSTYTFTYTDPRGYQDLVVVDILVNNFLDGRHACYLAYVAAQKALVLVDDAGDAGGPYAGPANSQCAATLVSAAGTGNNLTLVLTIAWTTSFAGDKIFYMSAGDVAQNNSGWQPLGVVRVPGGIPTTTTAVVSMNPTRGNGLGPTPFTFNWSDTLGFADLGVEDILVNSSLDGRHACYIAYSRPFNTLYLVNDNGDGLLPGQSVAESGSTSNSQCTVSWGSGAATTGGNTLSLTLNIGFTAAFGGNRIVYVAARDVNEGNSTDWHAMGTWTPE